MKYELSLADDKTLCRTVNGLGPRLCRCFYLCMTDRRLVERQMACERNQYSRNVQ
jgi:hypothetical protein